MIPTMAIVSLFCLVSLARPGVADAPWRLGRILA
jgi:hypothetical protein